MAAEIRFTLDARADLVSLALHSEDNFGATQARQYREGLQRSLELLSAFPLMGREQYQIEEGLRRHVHASHAIYYSIQSYGILIERILGPGQDPTQEFMR